MTSQTRISAFNARSYEVFAGLDVDKRSMAVTFTDWGRLVRSLRMPYSSEDLLRYVRNHFPKQRILFYMKPGQPALVFMTIWWLRVILAW